MTRLPPILLCLLAFAIASCGGDDSPSQQDFADRADEICRETKRSLEDVAEGAQTPGTSRTRSTT